MKDESSRDVYVRGQVQERTYELNDDCKMSKVPWCWIMGEPGYLERKVS